MKPINLQNIPSDFRDNRDIHTALAWNAIKKTLIEHHRGELFSHIQSVRITPRFLIITTGRPIINAEIKLYSESILLRFHDSLKTFGAKASSEIKLK